MPWSGHSPLLIVQAAPSRVVWDLGAGALAAEQAKTPLEEDDVGEGQRS